MADVLQCVQCKGHFTASRGGQVVASEAPSSGEARRFTCPTCRKPTAPETSKGRTVGGSYTSSSKRVVGVD